MNITVYITTRRVLAVFFEDVAPIGLQQIGHYPRDIPRIVRAAMVRAFKVQSDGFQGACQSHPLEFRHFGEQGFEVDVLGTEGVGDFEVFALLAEHASVIIAPATPDVGFGVKLADKLHTCFIESDAAIDLRLREGGQFSAKGTNL